MANLPGAKLSDVEMRSADLPRAQLLENMMATLKEHVVVVIIIILGFWVASLEEEHIGFIRMFVVVFAFGTVFGAYLLFEKIRKDEEDKLMTLVDADRRIRAFKAANRPFLDEDDLIKWCRKAAELGDADAQYNLGVMYSEGHGVPQSNAEAKVWFEKAAEQGNEDAQSILDDNAL